MKIPTTVIGSFPKPLYLNIPDWFKSTCSHVNVDYDDYVASIDNKILNENIKKARKEVIEEQINLGLDIITDGEITRDNYIYGLCRNIKGIDFQTLINKTLRDGCL